MMTKFSDWVLKVEITAREKRFLGGTIIPGQWQKQNDETYDKTWEIP